MRWNTKQLTQQEVDAISTVGTKAVGGVDGLIVNVSNVGTKTYAVRFMDSGERKYITLGSTSSMTIGDARSKAAEVRRVARAASAKTKAQNRIVRCESNVQEPDYLSTKSVASRYDVNPCTVWRHVKLGILPPPIYISKGTPRFIRKEIEAVEKARIQGYGDAYIMTIIPVLMANRAETTIDASD